MNWWGKIIGGLLGFMLGGPVGALIGGFLGHGVDQTRVQFVGVGGAARARQVFFRTTFSVMGHLAKSDGRVSEKEIGIARAAMDQMNLDEAQRREAIDLFTQGKDPDFPLDRTLTEFRQACGMHPNLVRMFVEILLRAAIVDGELSANEHRVLERICVHLGIPAAELDRLAAFMGAAAAGGGGHRRANGHAARPGQGSLAEAYRILGIDRDASDSEVKKAYRRLMNQHHPDKLHARGLPEEMMEMAKEKTVEIRGAYDRIKEARGMA